MISCDYHVIARMLGLLLSRTCPLLQLTASSGFLNFSATLNHSCRRARRSKLGHLLTEENIASMIISTYVVRVEMELSTVFCATWSDFTLGRGGEGRKGVRGGGREG